MRDPDRDGRDTAGTLGDGRGRPRPLVVCAHPDLAASNFSRPFFEAIDERLFDKKALAADYPDWRFDRAREQADIAAAASLVLVFPIFWYSPPALLQKWIEDVLVEGDATVAALEGKTVRLVVSTGGSESAYSPSGKNGWTLDDFLRPLETTLRYFGARMIPPDAYYASWQLSEDDVRALGARYADKISS